MNQSPTEVCKNKKLYRSITHAKHDAKEIRRKSGEIVDWYRCHVCKGIHVGHKEWR